MLRQLPCRTPSNFRADQSRMAESTRTNPTTVLSQGLTVQGLSLSPFALGVSLPRLGVEGEDRHPGPSHSLALGRCLDLRLEAELNEPVAKACVPPSRSVQLWPYRYDPGAPPAQLTPRLPCPPRPPSRLALENALKYGWRLNPIPAVRHLLGGHGNLPLVACYPALLLMALLALLLELVAHRLLQAELAVSGGLRALGRGAYMMSGLVARMSYLGRFQARSLHEGGCMWTCVGTY